MTTLSVLVSGLEELRCLGYKDSTLVWYQGCWRRMQKHFGARGVEEFSLDAVMAWVDDACGFFAKEQAWHSETNRRLPVQGRRDAAGLRRTRRGAAPLQSVGRQTQRHRYRDDRRVPGATCARPVVRSRRCGHTERWPEEFLAFTNTRAGLGCCDAAVIGGFVTTLTGYRVKTVEQKLCAFRSFLRFAAAAVSPGFSPNIKPMPEIRR
ncbi:hypothetical protein [Nocardia brasiliensis]|uniref:hypothetical protein n=1 Tax=Nocardia brasiliensis TaxID=37326 RepID=UPI00366B940C